MIGRAALMLACWCLAVRAEAELPAPPAHAELVAACAEATVLPEGETADASTIAAYCTCAMDEVAGRLTPAEFDVFGIVAIASLRNQPTPLTEEDVAGIDQQSFRSRLNTAVAQMRERCNPILFGPR